MSDSSKAATLGRKTSAPIKNITLDLPSTPEPGQSALTESEASDHPTPKKKPDSLTTPVRGLGSRATSALSLPMRDVPERRSSVSIFSQSLQGSRHPSMQELPQWRVPPHSKIVPSRGKSTSPVRRAIEKAPQSSDMLRASPSRTMIRTTPPLEILDRPSVRHERLQMSIHLPSPLYVGGGTVEGQIWLEIDRGSPNRKSKPKPMLISRMSLDIVGVEEVNDGRK